MSFADILRDYLGHILEEFDNHLAGDDEYDALITGIGDLLTDYTNTHRRHP